MIWEKFSRNGKCSGGRFPAPSAKVTTLLCAESARASRIEVTKITDEEFDFWARSRPWGRGNIRWIQGLPSWENCKLNKTGLQPVSRPLKQILGFFQKVLKIANKGSLSGKTVQKGGKCVRKIIIDYRRLQTCDQTSGNRIGQIWPNFYVVWTYFTGFWGLRIHFWGLKIRTFGIRKKWFLIINCEPHPDIFT